MIKDWSALTQWASEAMCLRHATANALPEIQVEVRLRGNHLHIHFSAPQCPPEAVAVSHFSSALERTNLESLLPPDQPPIYKIFLCGRQTGAKRPEWTVKLEYSPKTRSPQTLEPPSTPPPSSPQPERGGLFQGLRTFWNRSSGGQTRLTPTSASPPWHSTSPTLAQFSSEELLTPMNRGGQEQGNTGIPELDNPVSSNPERYQPSVAVLTEEKEDQAFPFKENHQNNSLNLELAFETEPIQNPKSKIQNQVTVEPPPDSPRLDLERESLETTLLTTSPEGATATPVETPTSEGVVSFSQTADLLEDAPELHRPVLDSGEISPSFQEGANPKSKIQNPKSSEADLPESSLAASTEGLARQGYPDAIASYLSEILGGLSVGVKVRIREKSSTRRKDSLRTKDDVREAATGGKRLLVLCEATYSPDPSLLAQPIAQRLRQLQLENFRDAYILLQVRGESTADWMLRIDLTPPDQILKEWARWGDEEAIAELLNQKLSPINLEVRATLKESTLHLFCHWRSGSTSDQSQKIPDKTKVMKIVTPLLESLAPQGICAVTVYGVEAHSSKKQPGSPQWIDWLNLPAFQYTDLQPTALTLAEQGNLSALRFLISRLINPNLEVKLATGGIRVMLLRKGDLLHVMSEAPTCPSQSQVVPPVAKFLNNHPIEGVGGVRIYGRRAGQKLPLWRYGVHLKSHKPKPAESVPDFNTGLTEADTGVGKAEDLILRPAVALEGLETEDLLAFVPTAKPRQYGWEDITAWLQHVLIGSGLFVTHEPVLVPFNRTPRHRYQKMALGVFWGALGCLLMVQVDWLLGQGLTKIATPEELDAPTEGMVAQKPEMRSTRTSWGTEAAQGETVFNGAGFISVPDGNSKDSLNNCESSTDALTKEACKLAQFLYPTFKSPQLDEQLARYQHFILLEKRPPDILVIGSSRALRGVDPTVLEQTLAQKGYAGLKVYNFGVNGATLQVVDLIVRQILPPEQLPKLIILADGVRALNSGRADRTYEAIATSEGYQQVSQGTFKITTPEVEEEVTPNFSELFSSLADPQQWSQLSWGEIQEKLHQSWGYLSATYAQRQQLKWFLQSLINRQTVVPNPATEAEPSELMPEEEPEASEFKSNGFLPLSIQFDPESYYQDHAHVSGYYDGDYQGFELEGKQTTALQNLVEYARSRQVDVVFVNMPLTEDYLDPVRTAYEDKFQQHMETLATETGFIFINLGFEWLDRYDYFSDPSHLNQYGAVAVSQRLAEETVIPWPQSTNSTPQLKMKK